MPMPDFYNIQTSAKTVLQAYAGLSGVVVEIEQPFPFSGGTQKWIGIFLDEVIPAPVELQGISAGTRTLFRVPLKIVCAGFSLNNHADAMEQCADVVKAALEALQTDYNLSGTVAFGAFERVDFVSFQLDESPGGWLRTGVIVILYDVTGTVP